ncbi:MAG TPA: glycoside hydrolase family 5 protein [Vitreimonas sp.]|uniref:glycoside hydrolase family 5 protein n=1 Tax=Vitreimonas sp. TaxID=3069702 RepID=UPI002D4AB28D|nr:glycoside hydrolase family 5 protein [Vitreimonas sp.]HYD87982.1 glycoside hydrolase family 5 protein [Vitreimonas sp.]
MNRREWIAGAVALAGCGAAESDAPTAQFPIRRGVNLGNALEAPNEGDWGYRIERAHLAAIAEAGFDGVRLPVRWDAHAEAEAPFAIDPRFFRRVDAVIDQALEQGLKVQLDLHHFDALIADAEGQRRRFIALWRQIARRYNQHPDALVFEPLNEPNGDRWRGEALALLQRDALAAIRESNPTRLVVFGPGNWQNIEALRNWSPPEGANVAVSAHYYEPHAFTHQDAEWLGDSAPRYDRAWGSDAEKRQIAEHIARAARWGASRGHAMQLGEFGVNMAVPLEQRAAWTRTVRAACEANEMGWCAWDFAGAFPIWDRERGRFIPDMLDALFG